MGYYGRNWTQWCRTCAAYRNMSRRDRAVCERCGLPWDVEPPPAHPEKSAMKSPRYAAVAQARDGAAMVVQSLHRTHAAAVRSATALAKSAGHTRLLYGVVELMGRTDGHVHAVGEQLDSRHAFWQRQSGGCSECCDGCRPTSLTYRCPLLAGSPPCEAALAARIELSRTPPVLPEEDP